MARHSGATRAAVSVTGQAGRLTVTVRDDGAGGCRIRPAGGLAGLTERLRTVDGSLALDSPPGGPTVVVVVLPLQP